MRVAMILAGTALLDRFHWIILFLWRILVYTGGQSRGGKTRWDRGKSPGADCLALCSDHPHYERRKFFTVLMGNGGHTFVAGIDSSLK